MGPLRSTEVSLRDAQEVSRAAIDLGGRPLPDSHDSTLIADYDEHPGARGGRTSGCGHVTRVTLPYTPHTGGAQFCTFCSICDGAPYMPKIAEKILELRADEEEARAAEAENERIMRAHDAQRNVPGGQQPFYVNDIRAQAGLPPLPEDD